MSSESPVICTYFIKSDPPRALVAGSFPHFTESLVISVFQSKMFKFNPIHESASLKVHACSYMLEIFDIASRSEKGKRKALFILT